MQSLVPEIHAGGEEEIVKLDPNHPGFRDLAYRQRRNEIARKALEYKTGDPAPRIDYTEEEHAVWRAVWQGLTPMHMRYGCKQYLEALNELALDHNVIPQLEDLNQLLEPKTGFRMLPVSGLISTRTFLSYMRHDIFLSTQYIRHGSVPLYTPEPDLVHEIVGHAGSFLHPAFAEINRLFGFAAHHADEALLTQLSNLYWHTVEFGATYEDGQLKAYGAGLLSSFGELNRFTTDAELRPLDVEQASHVSFDPTDYQPVIFVAESFDRMISDVTTWLRTHA